MPNASGPSPTSRPSTLQSLCAASSALQVPSADRIRALFAFTSKQKLTNPAGYEKNHRWWIDVVEEALREGLLGAQDGLDRLVISGDEEDLLRRLEWADERSGTKLRPKGLGGVLAALIQAEPPIFYPLQNYLSASQPIRQPPSLASRFVARPLWWAVSKVNPFGGGGDDVVETEEKSWKRVAKTEWVHLELVEEASTNLISHLRANPPVIHSATLLTPHLLIQRYRDVLLPSKLQRSKGRGVDLSSRDALILLKYLQRDKKVLVGDNVGDVFKISMEEGASEIVTLTEADKGTVAILTTLEKLDRQVEEVTKEISAAQSKAALHLNLKQKNVALSYLRSKKQLESVLDKRVGAAEQLRSVLRGIENAHGDLEIMRAYEASTAALKNVLAHPSLQRDHVDSTMDALAETMADQKEIDDAIQSGGQLAVSAAGIEEADDDELARELDALVKERDEEEKAQEESKAREQERVLVDRMAALRPQADTETVQPVSVADKSTTDRHADTSDTAQADEKWKAVYADAQARRVAEAARAEAGRLSREAKVYEVAQ